MTSKRGREAGAEKCTRNSPLPLLAGVVCYLRSDFLEAVAARKVGGGGGGEEGGDGGDEGGGGDGSGNGGKKQHVPLTKYGSFVIEHFHGSEGDLRTTLCSGDITFPGMLTTYEDTCACADKAMDTQTGETPGDTQLARTNHLQPHPLH